MWWFGENILQLSQKHTCFLLNQLHFKVRFQNCNKTLILISIFSVKRDFIIICFIFCHFMKNILLKNCIILLCNFKEHCAFFHSSCVLKKIDAIFRKKKKFLETKGLGFHLKIQLISRLFLVCTYDVISMQNLFTCLSKQ